MQTDMPLRSPIKARIVAALTPAEKRKAFEVAAARGLTASQFVRQLVINATSGIDRGAA